MTDTPETIWAVHWNTEGAVLNGAWADTIRHFGCGVEYRRADLPFPTAQIMADPRVQAMVDALGEARRAIGDHFAPMDCYTTGPLTGDWHRDMVECPACAFIAAHDAALAQLKEPKP